jgi:hypothetical protein
MRCVGKRGEWLTRLNPIWAKVVTESEEELWQTGSLEQRRQVIRSLRVSDPSRAREWIQQVWSEEDANTRLELLKLLAINISADDISFLEEIAKEKAKKVKEEAHDLLSRIPSSGLVRTAAALLLKLLGMKSGQLVIRGADAEDLKLLDGLGIEKLSNRKELSDDEFIVWQLLKIVPLQDLESAWGLDTVGLVRLFDGDVIGQKLFSGLVVAIYRFGDRVRALEMMRNAKTTYLDLFSLLPPVEQNEYAIKVFNEAADEITRYLATVEWEWSATLTQLIMNHANKNPYQYPKAFFSRLIHLIPVSYFSAPPLPGTEIIGDSVRDAVLKLLSLKQRTIQAFNE